MRCFLKKRLKEELYALKAFSFIGENQKCQMLYDTSCSHILLSIISRKILNIQNYGFIRKNDDLALSLDPVKHFDPDHTVSGLYSYTYLAGILQQRLLASYYS